MELLELKLNNFRNYQDLEVTFSPGVNVFLGPNAQGKTNLLEAIYVLALARSHRTTSDKELIGWEGKEAMVSGVVQRQYGKVPLSLAFTSKGKKAHESLGSSKARYLHWSIKRYFIRARRFGVGKVHPLCDAILLTANSVK